MTSASTSPFSAAPSTNNYRGEQWDSDLGLYYLRARYYNPLTGRFMSRDPEDGKAKEPRTLHKYLYVGGNPINAADPTGRDEEETVKLTAARAEITTTEALHFGVSVAGCIVALAAFVNEYEYEEHASATSINLARAAMLIACGDMAWQMDGLLNM